MWAAPNDATLGILAHPMSVIEAEITDYWAIKTTKTAAANLKQDVSHIITVLEATQITHDPVNPHDLADPSTEWQMTITQPSLPQPPWQFPANSKPALIIIPVAAQ